MSTYATSDTERCRDSSVVRWICRPTAFLLLLALVTIASIAPVSARADESVGQVIQQLGAVTALRATEPRAMHLGALVFRGDRIVTAAESKIQIEFLDGSMLSVGPDTAVEIANYSPESRRPGRLQLLIGIIRMSLSAVWRGDFEVRTRAAVASVRSTDWITEAREDRSSVFVVEGQVTVTGVAEDVAVRLSAGEGTDVEIGGVPSPPTRWGDARIQDVLARTRVP